MHCSSFFSSLMDVATLRTESEEPTRFAVVVGQARFSPDTDQIDLLEFSASPLLEAFLVGLRNAAVAPEEHDLVRIDAVYGNIERVPIVSFYSADFAAQELYVLELQFTTEGASFDVLLDGVMQAGVEFRRWRATRRGTAEPKRPIMIVFVASADGTLNEALARAANRLRPGATDTVHTYARAPPPSAPPGAMWPVLSRDLFLYLDLWADYVRENLERPLAARVAARQR
jgi:hypothetical protein